MARGLRRAGERIFNETFNDFHSRQLSGNAWQIYASCSDARGNQQPYPYKVMTQDMTQRYRKFKRTWGMFYAYDNFTGNSVSLKTRVRAESREITSERTGEMSKSVSEWSRRANASSSVLKKSQRLPAMRGGAAAS